MSGLALRSPALTAYLLLGGGLVVAGLALGRPEPVALASPFLLAAAAGLWKAAPSEVRGWARLESDRALEGAVTGLEIELSCARPASAEVRVGLPDGLRATGPASLRVRVGPRPRRLRMELECRRWGVQRLGAISVVLRDGPGLLSTHASIAHDLVLRVYPRPDEVRTLPPPLHTQAGAGDLVARQRGDGIEFAEIRPFVAGDLVRRINWRATARRGELQVSEQRAERNADVVIFLDSFQDLGGEGRSSLDVAVRAAAGLARHLLGRRDRVGMIGFGGTLRWLLPGSGVRQFYKVADCLLDTDALPSHAWKGLEVLPPRTLPPAAQVLALTPMLDSRVQAVLMDMAGRGHDLSVIEIPPGAFGPEPVTAGGRLAWRLWTLQREGVRHRVEALGVPVAVWDPALPVESALRGLEATRRFARAARV